SAHTSIAILWDLAPLSWTFRVLCCPAFERNGGAIAERGVEPPLVVVADVTGEGVAEDTVAGKRHAARQFGLRRGKERLRACIVARASHARALSEPAPGDNGTERRAHVFRPAIAVEDEPRLSVHESTRRE